MPELQEYPVEEYTPASSPVMDEYPVEEVMGGQPLSGDSGARMRFPDMDQPEPTRLGAPLRSGPYAVPSDIQTRATTLPPSQGEIDLRGEPMTPAFSEYERRAFGMPRAEREKALESIAPEPPPKFVEKLADAVWSPARGAAGVIGSGVKGVGIGASLIENALGAAVNAVGGYGGGWDDASEHAIYKLGQKIQDLADEIAPVDPRLSGAEKFIISDVPETVGGLAAFSSAGLPAALFGVAPVIPAALMFAGVEAASQYDYAKSRGASEGEALARAGLGGAVSAPLAIVPFHRLFQQLGGKLGVERLVKSAVGDALIGGGSMAALTGASNLVAGRPAEEGVVESGLAGGAALAFLRLGAMVIRNRKAVRGDSQVKRGVQGGEQVGQEPGRPLQEQVAGGEAPPTGGVLQAQESPPSVERLLTPEGIADFVRLNPLEAERIAAIDHAPTRRDMRGLKAADRKLDAGERATFQALLKAELSEPKPVLGGRTADEMRAQLAPTEPPFDLRGTMDQVNYAAENEPGGRRSLRRRNLQPEKGLPKHEVETQRQGQGQEKGLLVGTETGAATEAAPPINPEQNRWFTREKRDEAMKFFASLSGQTGAQRALDPELYRHLLDFAGYYLERAGRITLAEFKRMMRSELPKPISDIVRDDDLAKVWRRGSRVVVREREALKASLSRQKMAADMGYKAGVQAAEKAADLEADKRDKLYEQSLNKVKKSGLKHSLKMQVEAANAGYAAGEVVGEGTARNRAATASRAKDREISRLRAEAIESRMKAEMAAVEEGLVDGFRAGMREGISRNRKATALQDHVSGIDFKKVSQTYRDTDPNGTVNWEKTSRNQVEKIRAMLWHLDKNGAAPRVMGALGEAWDLIDGKLKGKASLRGLNGPELESLSEAVNSFIADMRNHESIKLNDKRIALEDAAGRVNAELSKRKPMKAGLIDRIFNRLYGTRVNKGYRGIVGKTLRQWGDTLSVMIERASGETRGLLRELYEQLAMGNADALKIITRFDQQLQDIPKQYGLGSRQINDMHNVEQVIRVPNSVQEVGVTPMEKIDLAMQLERPSTFKSVERHGFIREDMHGRQSEVVSAEWDADQLVRLHDEIVSGYTPVERAFHDTFRTFYDQIKDMVNQTTSETIGRPIAKEPNYAPRRNEKSLGPRRVEDITKPAYFGNMMLDDAGFLKDAPGADSPVVITDALKRFRQHADTAVRYAHMAIPARGMLEVLAHPKVQETLANTQGSDFHKTMVKQMQNQMGLRPFESDKVIHESTSFIRRRSGALARGVLAYNEFASGVSNAVGGLVMSAHIMREGGLRALGYFIREYAKISNYAPEALSQYIQQLHREILDANGALGHRLIVEAERRMSPTGPDFAQRLSRTGAGRAWNATTDAGLSPITYFDNLNTIAAYGAWKSEMLARQGDAVRSVMKANPGMAPDAAMAEVGRNNPDLHPDNINRAAGKQAMFAVDDTQNAADQFNYTPIQFAAKRSGLGGLMAMFTSGQSAQANFAKQMYFQFLKDPKRMALPMMYFTGALGLGMAGMQAYRHKKREFMDWVRGKGDDVTDSDRLKEDARQVMSDVADMMVIGGGKVADAAWGIFANERINPTNPLSATVAGTMYSMSELAQTFQEPNVHKDYGYFAQMKERREKLAKNEKVRAKSAERIAINIAKLFGGASKLYEWANIATKLSTGHEIVEGPEKKPKKKRFPNR